MPTAPTIDPQQTLGIPRSALPRHIAIIMDGNGRWAQQRGMPRVEGHRAGVSAVRETVTTCARLGIECLTLYSFSQENWKRPREEVEGLMALCAHYLVAERDELQQNEIRLRQIGRREDLPLPVRQALEALETLTAENRGLTLCLALNYGSRMEMLDAVRALARQAQQGVLKPDEIDEPTFAAQLYTRGMPDPDLVIRTADEMRLSNFLLWQISYAELVVLPVLWPDFRAPELFEAIRRFAARERRFGDVTPPAAH